MESQAAIEPARREDSGGTAFGVLGAISASHLLNDMMQSLILAIYPIIKGDFALSFTQIGFITLAYQLTASLLQPAVGLYTDRHPKPYSLPIGMGFTLVGLLLLAAASDFAALLAGAALVGTGSSIFHPESSRVARMASGRRPGLAQALFQVGGNVGASLGPLLAAAVIVPWGQRSIAWFSGAALVAIALLLQVSRWYAHHQLGARRKAIETAHPMALPQGRVIASLGILMMLVFSKYFYMASLGSYLTFFLIGKFHVEVQSAELHLFAFLIAIAAGTLLGGPVGDRISRKYVIWVSILGVTPFTMLLPYADLFWSGILVVIIGLVMASAFPAIVVYAQELVPGKVGAVSGLFFGFAFGMGGIGAAILGQLADRTSVEEVYRLCAFVPVMGVLAAFLPNLERVKTR